MLLRNNNYLCDANEKFKCKLSNNCERTTIIENVEIKYSYTGRSRLIQTQLMRKNDNSKIPVRNKVFPIATVLKNTQLIRIMLL